MFPAHVDIDVYIISQYYDVRNKVYATSEFSVWSKKRKNHHEEYRNICISTSIRVVCVCGLYVFEYPQGRPRLYFTILYILISWLHGYMDIFTFMWKRKCSLTNFLLIFPQSFILLRLSRLCLCCSIYIITRYNIYSIDVVIIIL